jgi:hypothetical protein
MSVINMGNFLSKNCYKLLQIFRTFTGLKQKRPISLKLNENNIIYPDADTYVQKCLGCNLRFESTDFREESLPTLLWLSQAFNKTKICYNNNSKNCSS